MAKIFISHSSRDNTFAMEIKEWLESQGFDQSFLDFDKHSGIEPGANWEKTLYREIDRSQAVLLVLTPNWNESKWCFAEYTQARALGKAIFPLTFVTIDDYKTASDTQYLDLTKDKVTGLQQLYEQLRQVALDAQGGFPWDKTRSPFPGLMYFTEEDAAIFFGRDDDVRRAIERLNARRTQGGAKLIALLGASGSGKSSLLRAGVLPRMKRDKKNWLVLPTIRPQQNPVHQFSRVLALASDQATQWKDTYDQLMGNNYQSTLVDCATQIRAVNNVLEPELLISLDQGEELFTIAEQKETRRFFEILNTIQKESLPFITITAMRSDFLGLLQKQEQLTERFEELSIKPIPLERIGQIIRGPAEVVGLDIEDSFVNAATNDAQTEDALPLLAFALRQLYERFGDDGDLTLEEYQALGDPALGLSPLENTVRSTADDVLRNENPTTEELKALREAFVPELVRINDEGEYVRRPALWDELPTKAYPLLEKLINARLLILHQDNDKKILEVTHEALLRKWKTLHDWLNEEREFLIGKGRLEQSLIDWQQAEEEQKDLALLGGLQLTRAREWLIKHPRQLTEDERGYIQNSIELAEAEQKRKERLRKMFTWGSVAASVILALAAVFVGSQWKKAEYQKNIAIITKLSALSKVAQNQDNNVLALLLANQAVRFMKDTDSSNYESYVSLANVIHGNESYIPDINGIKKYVITENIFVAYMSDGSLAAWDMHNADLIHSISYDQLKHTPSVMKLISNKNILLTIDSLGSNLYIWDALKLRLKNHINLQQSENISKFGHIVSVGDKYVVLVNDEGNIIVVDYADNKIIVQDQIPKNIRRKYYKYNIESSINSKYLSIGRAIFELDLKNKPKFKKIFECEHNGGEFSPKNENIYLCGNASTTSGNHRKNILWDLRTQTQVNSNNLVSKYGFHQDYDYVAEIANWPSSEIPHLVGWSIESPRKDYFITLGRGISQNTIFLWDAKTMKPLHKDPLIGGNYNENTSGAKFDKIGDYLLIYNKYKLKLFDLKKPFERLGSKQFNTIGKDNIQDVMFSEDNSIFLVITGGESFSATFMNVRTNMPFRLNVFEKKRQGRESKYSFDDIAYSMDGNKRFIWKNARKTERYEVQIVSQSQYSSDGKIKLIDHQKGTSIIFDNIVDTEYSDIALLHNKINGLLWIINNSTMSLWDENNNRAYDRLKYKPNDKFLPLSYKPPIYAKVLLAEENNVLKFMSDIHRPVEINLDNYFKKLDDKACKLANRNLSKEEWRKYIGVIFEYDKTNVSCPEYSLWSDKELNRI